MKILGLTVENVKRLRAAHIEPGETGLIVVGGRNAQGKSTLLDSIVYALAGGRSVPGEPVHKGAKKGSVSVDLGEYFGDPKLKVKRTFTPGGGGTVTVTSADGLKYPSPQAVLDKLYGDLTFDPLDFLRADAKRQTAMIQRAVGLDLSGLSTQEKGLRDERTTVNRDADKERAAAELIAATLPDEVPEPVDVVALSAELQAGVEANAGAYALKAAQERAAGDIETAEEGIASLSREIHRLQGALKLKQEDLEEKRASYAIREKEIAETALVDTEPIRAQIAGAERIQQIIRQRETMLEHATQAEEAGAKSERLTASIEQIAEERRAAIAAAELGVEGLEYDGEQVRYQGLPLDQASQAEGIRVSLAVGMAANPDLRVLLIRDGSLLDQENLQAIRDMATANGRDYQIWIERVGVGPETSVVIEDGESFEPEAA